MKETLNIVNIAGKLVKKSFDIVDVDVKDEKGNVVGKDKAIRGTLTLRTDDGSEHDVNYYSRMTKKDGNPNQNYKALETVNNEYKTMEKFPEDYDHVQIGFGQFNVKDYKGQDGTIKTYNNLRATFANRMDLKQIETTPLEAKFEIEGIVESIQEELYKDEPTGNYRVKVNVIGYNDTIIPVNLVVLKETVEPFSQAGFFEGGYAKFTGKLVNTTETETVVEKMAFGEDNVKTITKTVSRFELLGGNPMGTPYEHDVDPSEYEQAKSKRKLKLDELLKAENKPKQQSSNPFGSSTGNSQPSTNANPFANPFA